MAFFKRKKGYAKSQSYSTVKRIEPTIIGIFDGFKVEVVDPVAIMRLNFEVFPNSSLTDEVFVNDFKFKFLHVCIIGRFRKGKSVQKYTTVSQK